MANSLPIRHSSVQIKWIKSCPNLKKGDVVIVRSKQLHRNEWPLAVIETPYTSSDGVAHSYEIRMKNGVFRRAAIDLVLLSSAAEPGVSQPKDS